MSSPTVTRTVDLSRTYALLDESLWSASVVIDRSVRAIEEEAGGGNVSFADGRERIRELESVFVSPVSPNAWLSSITFELETLLHGRRACRRDRAISKPPRRGIP